MKQRKVTPIKLRTFRVGDPPKRGEGLRIGATRRPPRGVPKRRWQTDGYFDVWLPAVAPSARLLLQYRARNWDDASVRRRFFDAYERELTAAPARQTVALLAAVAARTPIAIGCFCADDARCHRSRLYEVIRRTAAGFRPGRAAGSPRAAGAGAAGCADP